MAEKKSLEGLDIEKLSGGELAKRISVRSWLFLFSGVVGAVVGAFWAGYQAPVFLNKVQPSELLMEERNKTRELEKTIEGLKGELAAAVAELAALQTSNEVVRQEVEQVLSDAKTELQLTEARYKRKIDELTEEIVELTAEGDGSLEPPQLDKDTTNTVNSLEEGQQNLEFTSRTRQQSQSSVSENPDLSSDYGMGRHTLDSETGGTACGGRVAFSVNVQPYLGGGQVRFRYSPSSRSPITLKRSETLTLIDTCNVRLVDIKTHVTPPPVAELEFFEKE